LLTDDEIVDAEVSILRETVSLRFGSFCCSHPQSAICYNKAEYYTEYDKEQLSSRGCNFFKHGASTLEGEIRRPKKKVSGTKMMGNLKYLEGGYIMVYVIARLFTQS